MVLAVARHAHAYIAPILFKVEAYHRLELGKESCTSHPCVWNQTSVKKVCHYLNNSGMHYSICVCRFNHVAYKIICFFKPKHGESDQNIE